MANLEEWTVTEPWLSDLRCALGEGPFYEKETNTVRFVDIKKKHIHTVSVSDGPSAPSLKTLELDVCPTVTVDIEGADPRDRILVGLKYGTAILDRKTGKYEMIGHFHEPRSERVRSNDGAADPNGRFWLGSMTDFGWGDFLPEGSLYRFGVNNKEEILQNLTIPNSVGWSPDQKTMYFTHSKSREVFSFAYDPSTGATTNQRLFYLHDGTGEPDGFRVDVNGNIWHAVYGEGLVLKLSPQGKVLGKVKLPTRNITCVQFVGTELVITSAQDGDAAEGSESERFGGAVFRVDVGVRGLDLFEFKMEG